MNWLKENLSIQKLFHGTDSAKLTVKNQVTFFESINNFLKNGFSLNEAIDFYTVVHPQLKASMATIKLGLARGHGFAESVKDLINFRIYCQLQIAEFHGNLLSALDSIDKYLKLKQQQRSKVISLLIYPVFLLVLLIGIVMGIHVLINPQLRSSNDQNTQGNFFWWIIALIPVGLLIYGGWQYWRGRSRRWQLNTLLKVPLIGRIYRAYYAYYFSSNLALMMSCGMDLKQIVKFMRSFKDSKLIQKLSWDVQTAINSGQPLKNLRTKYHFLPRNMMLLLDTGDTPGVLAQKLKSYSEVEFRLMVKQSSRLISMFQPVMFLIIGLVITGTYLSMLLPMYQSIKGVY